MKEKVDVTGVPETMLQTRYARAKETKKSETFCERNLAGCLFYAFFSICMIVSNSIQLSPPNIFTNDN